MLKRPVIAADITNLTDARYFASWGIDFLMYDLNHINIDKIKEISSWLEGVNTLVMVDKKNVHLLKEATLTLTPFAVGTSETNVLDQIVSHISEGPLFFYFNETQGNEKNKMVILTDVKHINPITYQIDQKSNPITFAEIQPTVDKLEEFLSQNESSGIILRGSSEIETGLKSFENIDKLLEILEE